MESHLSVSASFKGEAAEKGFSEDKEGLLSQERHSWKGALCPAVQGSKPQHAGHYPQCLLEASSFPPKYLALIFFSNTWL